MGPRRAWATALGVARFVFTCPVQDRGSRMRKRLGRGGTRTPGFRCHRHRLRIRSLCTCPRQARRRRTACPCDPGRCQCVAAGGCVRCGVRADLLVRHASAALAAVRDCVGRMAAPPRHAVGDDCAAAATRGRRRRDHRRSAIPLRHQRHADAVRRCPLGLAEPPVPHCQASERDARARPRDRACGLIRWAPAAFRAGTRLRRWRWRPRDAEEVRQPAVTSPRADARAPRAPPRRASPHGPN